MNIILIILGALAVIIVVILIIALFTNKDYALERK